MKQLGFLFASLAFSILLLIIYFGYTVPCGSAAFQWHITTKALIGRTAAYTFIRLSFPSNYDGYILSAVSQALSFSIYRKLLGEDAVVNFL